MPKRYRKEAWSSEKRECRNEGISSKVNYTKKTFGEDVELEKTYNITRPISFTLLKDGEKSGINFNGIPGGHEFNSFILAIFRISWNG